MGRFAFDLGGRYQGDGDDHQGHTDVFGGDEVFVEEEEAEQDGDHGVDVGVGGDFADGDVGDEPDVGGVADPGAEDDQVGDGVEGGAVPLGLMLFAEEKGEGEVDGSGEEHLPGGGDEDVDGELGAAGEQGADGPG